MRCHVQLILMAHCYRANGGRTGACAAENAQKINLIFMFMINSSHKFLMG